VREPGVGKDLKQKEEEKKEDPLITKRPSQGLLGEPLPKPKEGEVAGRFEKSAEGREEEIIPLDQLLDGLILARK